jgi:hypothetical protein
MLYIYTLHTSHCSTIFNLDLHIVKILFTVAKIFLALFLIVLICCCFFSSNGVQENLEAGLLGPAVDQFSILAAVTNILESSSCENLKLFSQEMQVFWRRVLIEKLSR